MQKPVNDSFWDKDLEASQIEADTAVLLPNRRGSQSAAPVDVTALRQRLHMSMEEFAVLLGVSARTVCNWETGKTLPRPDLATILQIIDVDPQQALTMLRRAAEKS